ncbi:DNA adenine methylase [Laspinema olomoucense]|uniref:Site-specific DNA-methyltransferase (adenine-specific) n=1 Tax=Laspinema olomoucense D3b TaxID=2953688 RepID=A0ABT2N7L7_9CYAN|nr:MULTISPECIES: DNA adenine methylase [unclassified Laspinema]MCT7973578.1 DNA adenine methylase [Laspinema sp. D3d]MCT7978679.1 DNA adenine methylase [Laspinema sp. D3b]MCT7989377.1 DNA adenine methylase [Laspinema sp. D3a]
MNETTAFSVLPRPFLKWAGGKTQLISQYQPLFPPKFKNYYEPFLGGGAVFFYLFQEHSSGFKAVLSDVNEELINMYRCVQKDVKSLIKELEFHQNRHNSEYYYQVRAQKSGELVKKAARIIYLNKTCFNGLYRENSKGEFNVPIGRYKNPTICNAELLQADSQALQSVQLEVRDFDKVLDEAKTEQDFVYFDPPYYPLSNTSKFTSYSRYNFNEEDQIRLRDVFAQLARRGVKVMLSNSDCPFIREIYQEFRIHEVSAARSINSKGTHRGKISEVVVTSY